MKTFVSTGVNTLASCSSNALPATSAVAVSLAEVTPATTPPTFKVKAIVTAALLDPAKACLDAASKTKAANTALGVLVGAINTNVVNVGSTAFKSQFVTSTVFKGISNTALGSADAAFGNALKAAAKRAFCDSFNYHHSIIACDMSGTVATATLAAPQVDPSNSFEINVEYDGAYDTATSKKVVEDMLNNEEFINTNILTSAVKTATGHVPLTAVVTATNNGGNPATNPPATDPVTNTNSGMDPLSWFFGGLVGSAIAAAAFVGVYCVFLKGDAAEDKSKK
jgi:hypothetical protein